ncbi:TetR/AcrR family transcriptional regulator [Actinokineospora sp.]|uniref:TetR/AcrR family transcriptional regulator n=1 Tax=Actinokineospora sp. TaxID=1872133 RepID=UPI003D6A2F66
MTPRSYHHGDLRRAVLDAAAAAITEHGPASISLRDLARRAGVSHAAPGHHFGDKAGVLTALAAEGYDLLADALRAAQESTGQLVELGVAYVRFAVEHRAHFEVMFRPDLYRADDPAVVAARGRSGDLLVGGVGTVDSGGADAEVAKVAAWSIVHGFATLWITGALPAGFGDDPEAAARSVAGLLFANEP